MRYAMSRKLGIGAAAVAAASLSAWLGAPAKGDLIPVVMETNIGTGTDAGLTEFVIGATNNGLNGTGTNLIAFDATVTTPGTGTTGAIFVDLKADVDGDGTNDANVLDQLDATNGTKPPSWGSRKAGVAVAPLNGFLGTFMAVPSDPAPANENNFNETTQSTNFVNQGVFVNAQTAVENGGASGVTANYKSKQSATAVAPAGVDPAFLAGTVHALEFVGLFQSATFKGPSAVAAPVPFANIVIPTGVTGTLQGNLGGDQGLKENFFMTFPTVVTTATASITLTGTGTSTIGPINLVAGPGPGSYVAQSVTAGGTAGVLQVNGFSPADQEIYALTTTDTLAQIQAALGSNLTAKAVSPAIATLFPSATVEVDAASGFNPAFFSFSGVPISAIGVVPEPTSIGFLVLGGAGLLARRKRRSA